MTVPAGTPEHPTEQPYLARRQNWTNQLARHALMQPGGTALRHLGATTTWIELERRVTALAGALHRHGVGFGDRVLILMLNRTEFVESVLAVNKLGAIAVPVNFRMTPAEIAYLVSDCAAAVVVTEPVLAPVATAVRDLDPALATVIVAGAATEDGVLGYEDMVAENAPCPTVDIPNDSPALIMYTSGTTGRPKGVELTQANLIAHTVNAHQGFEFDEGDKNMVSMPLFHVGGMSYVQFGVYDGIPSVMTRDVDGAALAGAILKGANRTFLVPAVLAKVLETGEDAVKLFGALKTYGYGASPMPLPLLRQALDAWPDTDFVQAYGLTEVCGVISQLLPDAHRAEDHPERLTSAGTLVPNAEVRVVDPDTLEDVPTGEQGELWFRTPQLMKGYHNRPEATAEAITPDGWFRTGDIGRVDDGGYIFVEDRLKDMIISGGENIYSPEVERVLSEHPAVAEVAVIGVPDDRWGESVKAVVALKEGASATEADIVEFCRDQLARYKCPRSVDVVLALPRNPTGKILKQELRGRFERPPQKP